MPRYFFDVRCGDRWATDDAGETFADLASAADAALDIIQSIVRDERAAALQVFAIRVRDASDRVRHEISFTVKSGDASSDDALASASTRLPS